jgi:Four helix bundle sensory module for signal transduction
MQVAFLLSIILFVVFANNVMESRNVTELGGSFSSVYEDRLLVESYIYNLSDHLYQKKIMLDHCDLVSNATTNLKVNIDQHNSEIQTLIHNYEITRLTENESRVFDEFKINLDRMASMERDYIRLPEQDKAEKRLQLNQQFFVVAKNLNLLSAIQIEEAKRLNDDSKRIIAGFTMLTQFEMAILIGIGLIILALILSSSQINPRQVVDSRLN